MRTEIKYPIYSNEKGTNHFGFLFFYWTLWEIIPREAVNFFPSPHFIAWFSENKRFSIWKQKQIDASSICHKKCEHRVLLVTWNLRQLSRKIRIWEIWQEYTWVVEKFQGTPSLHYKVGRNSEQAREVKVIAWSTNGQNIRKLISYLSNLIFGDCHVQTT